MLKITKATVYFSCILKSTYASMSSGNQCFVKVCVQEEQVQCREVSLKYLLIYNFTYSRLSIATTNCLLHAVWRGMIGKKKEEINITRHAAGLTNHQHNFVKNNVMHMKLASGFQIHNNQFIFIALHELVLYNSFKLNNHFVRTWTKWCITHLSWSWIVLYSGTYVCTIHAHIHKCIHASTHPHTDTHTCT